MRQAASTLVVLISICLCPSLPPALGADEAQPDRFTNVIQPILQQNCYACHNAQENEGELDLARLTSGEQLAANADLLQSMREIVSAGFMPPQKAPRQPSAKERRLLLDWLDSQLQHIATLEAGNPGQVVLRRLTNAELNETLTDLTGIERNWTQAFPHDSSGGEGFSNTGQTLQMSAGQIEKYLALAQQVTDHALMLPGSGPVFWNTPVTTIPAAERGRLALERLDAFCRLNQLVYRDITPREQLTSYAYPDVKSHPQGYDHLRGYKRFSNDVPGATLSFIGSTHRLFYRTERLNPTPATYMIHQGELGAGPPSAEDAPELQQKWEELWLDLRFTTGYARPAKISLLHRWFSHQTYQPGDNPKLEVAMTKWQVGDGKSPDGYKRYSLDPLVDLSFTVLSLANFADRIRSFTDGELLDFFNIQHSRDGESRALMIPNHDAFDAFIHQSFDDDQIEMLWRMACDVDSPLAKRLGGIPSPEMREQWQAWTKVQQGWQEAVVPAAQRSICEFTSRAWRRPLSDSERTALKNQLRFQINSGRPLTEAMNLTLIRVLMAPHFLYRMEFGNPVATGNETGIRSLNDFELASRLSYFLWSSIPDQRLRDLATRGELRKPETLAAEARRMLIDPRIRRFSREMFGQWLGFYRFQDFDRPDQTRFPEFDTELRKQMYHEALDFCTDLVATDRDIRSLLNASYGFLPRRLADHYGVPLAPNEHLWKAGPTSTSIEPPLTTAPLISLAETNRRGVLGWGTTLTKSSHPLRTSPVLRGNWILDDLLGIPTPPPPPAIPELPDEENNPTGLTTTQLLARHRQDQACAACHDRIDPLGIALESFDPIGKRRNPKLNQTSDQTLTTLHDGTKIENFTALVNYLQQEKQTRLFTRRLTRKVLGYALGRSIQPGDTLLLKEIERKLATEDYRFSVIIEAIVTSNQFRHLKHDR